MAKWTRFSGTAIPNGNYRFVVDLGGTAAGEKGPQYLMANPLNPGGRLRTNYVEKRKTPTGRTHYVIDFKNVGTVSTTFNIQGGEI